MAKLLLLSSLSALIFFVAGCQQQTAMIDLPSPNFSGPVVAQQAQPLPRPVVVAPFVPKQPAPAVTAAVPADWIPHAPLRNWEWIVIHHSATVAGGAARFDRDHREKGWDELGYDFVIGNGTDTGDGQIEVGPRWVVQKWGAHAKTPDNRFNDRGIGICLVGNFDNDHPTAAQMRSLVRLTTYLMKTYHIKPDDVIGHNDTKKTDCPGRNLSVATVRHLCVRALADAGEPVDESPARTASTELLVDSPAQAK